MTIDGDGRKASSDAHQGDPNRKSKPYLYQNHTWDELGDLVSRQPVVILPIGSVEDHGLHLPLDVDNFLIWEICEAAARKAQGNILLSEDMQADDDAAAIVAGRQGDRLPARP